MTYTSKITSALAMAAIVAGTIAPAAFANTTVTVSHNGVLSHTNVHVTNNTGSAVVQNNKSAVVTFVNSNANTGDNHTSFNTGGGNVITTGPATSNVNVTVGGSKNKATVPSTPTNNTNVTVSNNGVLSHNDVNVTNNTWSGVVQNNSSFVLTGVNSNAETGDNSASFNTHGVNSISTDAATSTVNVTVGGSSNTLN